MRALPGSKRELTPTEARWRALPLPLLAALGLSLLGFLAVGLAGARPAMAGNATQPPFTEGRHVYDQGGLLSASSVKTAETMASDIEAAGGARVVIYTATPKESQSIPDDSALVADWHIDGLLLTSDGSFESLTVGTTLKGKLTSDQAEFLTTSANWGEGTIENWMMGTLATVDAFLHKTHVIDGAGILDASGRQQAEAAATDLGNKIGATVYVDIALGGDDPEKLAAATTTEITTSLSQSMAICFGVSGTTYGGAVEIDPELSIFDYKTTDPWASNGVLSNRTAANGDVQAAILAAIGDVHSSSLNDDIIGAALPWIIFTVVIVIFSISAPFLWGPWLIRKLSGTTGPIKGGLPGDAIIESIADTGTTVTMSGVGAYAPDYKFVLQVTPAAGGAPYQVETKALVPRIYIPMVVPGAHVGVQIDPTNPQKVSIDFSRMGGAGSLASGGSVPAGGFSMAFDASGQPAAADVAALAGGVRSGAVRQIKASADHVLAIGTHGTAVITTAMPLGKTVRDVNPAADPSRLNDPMWLFTVEVTLAGQALFPRSSAIAFRWQRWPRWHQA